MGNTGKEEHDGVRKLEAKDGKAGEKQKRGKEGEIKSYDK